MEYCKVLYLGGLGCEQQRIVDQEYEREMAALDARERRYCLENPTYRDMYIEDCDRLLGRQ
jgi:hypothetical protein